MDRPRNAAKTHLGRELPEYGDVLRSIPGTPTGARDLEAAVSRVAARQHGVVTRAQLLGLGLRPGAVTRRVAAGRLTALHRGVYRVGPLVASRSREMAAVLACGQSAALSHGNAADLLRIIREWRAGVVEVTVEGPIRRRPGIRVHRVRTLPADEVTRVEGIPVTTPARTLIDLAGSLASPELKRAVAQAMARWRTDREEVLTKADRYRRHRGVWRLRALMSDTSSPAHTRSPAEDRFLELVRDAGLPAPKSNVRVGVYEVDFLWPAQRFVVEIDGFGYHATRASFEADRRRDADLAAAGLHVIRVTWRQIQDGPLGVVGRLARALGRVEAGP